MCGIAGFFGAFSEPELQSMVQVLRHRGPDGAGMELIPCGEVSLGFGHCRLSIIDLTGGHQPLWSTERNALIVFNGEIYNYRALRRELQALGRVFATSSDTEVILEGWLVWGEKVLDRLSGMFAFAIWDLRKRVLFLARDRFGIKPLYYCCPCPGQFVFASEIKPLLPFVGGAQVHCPAMLDYLLHGWSSLESTIFKGIQQLLPGCAMLWEPSKHSPQAWRYWRLQSAPLTAHDWPALVRHTLDQAVQLHLVADVPVGIMLSGGLDSSAVLASMVKHVDPSQLGAFCVGYGLPDDEIPYARSVAAHYGVSLTEKIVPISAFADNFAHCIWSLEEPIAHPVMQTTYQASAFVREYGKVVLIGEGSDELFAGYPEFRLLTFPYTLLPLYMRRQAFKAVCCLMPTARELQEMLRPPWRDAETFHWLEKRFDPYFAAPSSVQGALAFELEYPLPFNQLSRVDKLTMAHSIEARVPFLDHEFAAMVMAIPFREKVRRGVHKRVLREAMMGRLPPAITSRPKSGRRGTQALLPTVMRLVTAGPLSPLISRESLGARGWFEPDVVLKYLGQGHNRLISLHPIERRRRAKFALALAVLEQWARIFLDGERPAVH